MTTEIGKLVVKLAVDKGTFAADMDDASKSLSNATKMGIGMIAVGGAIVGAMAAMVKSLVNSADAFDEMSQRTGVSTQALRTFANMAELAGGSSETIEKAITKMSIALGSGKADDSLKRLGISLKDLSKLNTQDSFNLIMESLAGVSNQTDRASIAQDIFGKGASALLPLLEGGAEAYNKRKKASEADTAAQEKAGQVAKDIEDKFKKLQTATKSLTDSIAVHLLPTIRDFIRFAEEITTSITKWTTKHPTLTKAITITTAAIGLITIAVGALTVATVALIAAWVTLNTATGGIVLGIAVVIGAVVLLIANFKLVKVLFLDVVASMVGALATGLAFIPGIGAALKTAYDKIHADALKAEKEYLDAKQAENDKANKEERAAAAKAADIASNALKERLGKEINEREAYINKLLNQVDSIKLQALKGERNYEENSLNMLVDFQAASLKEKVNYLKTVKWNLEEEKDAEYALLLNDAARQITLIKNNGAKTENEIIKNKLDISNIESDFVSKKLLLTLNYGNDNLELIRKRFNTEIAITEDKYKKIETVTNAFGGFLSSFESWMGEVSQRDLARELKRIDEEYAYKKTASDKTIKLKNTELKNIQALITSSDAKIKSLEDKQQKAADARDKAIKAGDDKANAEKLAAERALIMATGTAEEKAALQKTIAEEKAKIARDKLITEQYAKEQAQRDADLLAEQVANQNKIDDKTAKEAEIAALEEKAANDKIAYDKTVEDNKTASAEREKEQRKKMKPFLIAEAIANTYLGAAKALGQLGIFGAIAAGVIIAAGMANVAMIDAQRFADGGIVGGSSYVGDNVHAMVNSGEMILNGQQQAKLFAIANGETTNNSGDTVININGDVDGKNIDGICRKIRDSIKAGHMEALNLSKTMTKVGLSRSSEAA